MRLEHVPVTRHSRGGHSGSGHPAVDGYALQYGGCFSRDGWVGDDIDLEAEPVFSFKSSNGLSKGLRVDNHLLVQLLDYCIRSMLSGSQHSGVGISD